jgi:hypothetical protein
MMEEIIIKDETIISFYKENPNLNFITMNHILIDILKKLSINISETINNTMNERIYNTLNHLVQDFTIFKNDINQNNVNQFTIFIDKVNQNKRDYIEDIKILLSNHSLTNIDKINSIIDRHNDALITKTNIMINEVIPKSNEIYYSQVSTNINELSNFVNEQTNKIIQASKNENKDDNKNVLEEFIKNVDSQFNRMILNLQQPIFNYIQASEERTMNNIQRINDKIQKQETMQETLNTEIRGFLSRYTNNSSVKGKVSEAELYNVLQNIFPSDEIINCSQNTANCDYCVNRLNHIKPSILFENKDYSRSVSTEEVEKFQRDVRKQQTHGILLSQNTGITYKDNFQIEIINGLIHVYIHNVNYSVEKIKIAVDIIDNLSPKIHMLSEQLNETNINLTIEKEDIDELHNEYLEFNEQKNNIIENIKISNKQIIDRIESLQLNSIKKLLNKHNLLNDNDLKCNICNFFTGKNKASLAQHVRKCKLNKNITIDIPSNKI